MNRPIAGQRTDPSTTTVRRNAGPIAHAEMTAAIAAGTAQTLSRTITDIARYQSRWWLYDREEWILADDAALVADLEAAAALMADVDQRACTPRPTP